MFSLCTVWQPLRDPQCGPSFSRSGRGAAIANVLGPPRASLPAWYIVSRNEVLEQTLLPAIKRHGYYSFKLKVTGTDTKADVERTVQVYRKATEACGKVPRITVDSNEANKSTESVLDYLLQLQAADAAAYESLEYLEQPTDRDIRGNAFDWRDVTRLKPVLLDEGLTDLCMLEEALRQNYSGFAHEDMQGAQHAASLRRMGTLPRHVDFTARPYESRSFFRSRGPSGELPTYDQWGGAELAAVHASGEQRILTAIGGSV